ncbi:MAG: hypothetical protein V1837_01360 [Candidatus Woesearchaeota archaeon]
MKVKYFSFGATSAVITGLAVIVGFSGTANAKISIISALLLIAIADNISDSFGIHVHEECQSKSIKENRRTTYTNFLTRILVVAVFVIFVLSLPSTLAIALSITFGLLVITWMSYAIAKQQKAKTYRVIFHHVLLTVVVMTASFILKEVVSGGIQRFL